MCGVEWPELGQDTQKCITSTGDEQGPTHPPWDTGYGPQGNGWDWQLQVCGHEMAEILGEVNKHMEAAMSCHCTHHRTHHCRVLCVARILLI